MKLFHNTATPVEPYNLLIRFHNQIGAVVDITGTSDSSRWTCHGCGHGDGLQHVDSARQAAHRHAVECRAAYHRLDR
ncbi:hypothetical protein [Streptomyces sp. NPDC029721]|uniref:hypothetical protein n=1 Tax=Streptomyces sp. NPDC029721 TaxID=3157090 RepID=UPI003405DC0F